MTFSAHYLKNKIAWIDPEFLEQQLAESTKDKKTETNVNSMNSPKTTIRSNLLVDTTNTAIEIKSPAQTRKQTVAENLEMNALKVKLKETWAENIKLKSDLERLETELAKEKRRSNDLQNQIHLSKV